MPVYAKFVDFEKRAFTETLSGLYSGVMESPNIESIINLLYGDYRSKVIHVQFLTEEFEIKIGVKQGCILSPFLFCLGI